MYLNINIDYDKIWDNAQVPPQHMSEISETHLYYTNTLLSSKLILLIIFHSFFTYVTLLCGSNAN